MSFANRSRRIMPALYNSLRESEQPILPTNASGGEGGLFDETLVDDADQNIGIDHVEEEEDGLSALHDSMRENQQSVSTTNESSGDDDADGDEVDNVEEQDIKPNVLPEVQLDASDLNAFDALCNTDSDSDSDADADEEEIDVSNDMNNETDPLANNENEQISEDDSNGAVGSGDGASISFYDVVQDNAASDGNGTDINDESTENGHSVQSTSNPEPKTVEINESLEMIYSSLQDFRPYTENEFQVKANDSVCQNRPFKQNVRILSLYSTTNE